MKLGVVLGIALLVALSASDVLDNTAPPIGPPADKGTMMALYYAQATGALGIHVVNPFGFESLVTPFHRDNAFLLGVGQFAFDRAANVFYAVRAQRGTNTAEIIGINVLSPTSQVVRLCKFASTYTVQSLMWSGYADILLAVLIDTTTSQVMISSVQATLFVGGTPYVAPGAASAVCQTGPLSTGASTNSLISLTRIIRNPSPPQMTILPGMSAFDSKNNVIMVVERTSGSLPTMCKLHVYSALEPRASDPLSPLASLDFVPTANNPAPPSNVMFVPNAIAGQEYFAIVYVDPQDGKSKVYRCQFNPNSNTIVQFGSLITSLTSEQVLMYSGGALVNSQPTGTSINSQEIVLNSRHNFDATKIYSKPVFWDAAQATTYRSNFFTGQPLEFFFADSPSVSAMRRCCGFNGNVNEIVYLNAVKTINNGLMQCRWTSTSPAIDIRNAMVYVNSTTSYCTAPQIPNEPRAAGLSLSISNDGFHFGPNVFAYPIYDPTTNISDTAIRNYDTYYYLDLGIPASLSLTLSSSSNPNTAFTPSTIVFTSEARRQGGLYIRFKDLGVNTIVGTVTKCPTLGTQSPDAALPPPSFTIAVVVKEFVGTTLPTNIVNNADPLTVFVYLGAMPPTAGTPYTVTFTAAITAGVGTLSTDPLVYRGQSVASFSVVGRVIGPLEITLTPSGLDAANFATMKFTTNVVSVNMTALPDNIRKDTSTIITVNLDRAVAMVFDLALTGVTGTVSPTLTFVNSKTAFFSLTSSAYGYAIVTLTPRAGAASPDFNLFSATIFNITVAEIFTTDLACPRLPRPAPIRVGISVSSPKVSLDVAVAITSGTATLSELSPLNTISFNNANTTFFVFSSFAPGALSYRITPVGGADFLRSDAVQRFSPTTFTCQIGYVELKLDLGTSLVQNQLQTVRATLDLASNVTWNVTIGAGNLTISKTQLIYPLVDTDSFTLFSSIFGPASLTFQPSGFHAGDCRTTTFNFNVVGAVTSNLPASVFLAEEIPVIFTISGNAIVDFAITTSSGVNVSTNAISYNNVNKNTTNGNYSVTVRVIFSETGLRSITLTPTGGADKLNFAPTVFTVSASPNPAVACSAGLITCPDKASCRKVLSDCPTIPSCPLDRPFKCSDGQCAVSSDRCITLPSCPNGGVRCPDFTCATVFNQCPAGVTCPSTLPIKCYDGTCRKSVLDCDPSPVCPSGQFACPSGACVASADLCPRGPVCNQGEVLCPDLTCKNSLASCPTTLESAACPPAQSTLCSDGTCVAKGTTCPTFKCSSGLTFCPTGECAEGISKCTGDNGCPGTKPFKCADGTCAENAGTCPSTQATCSSTSRPFQCPDGSCAQSAAFCPAKSGCPATAPILCADKVNCVAKDVQCPPISVCDPRAPFKCSNGLCVTSLTLCELVPAFPVCPSAAESVACADGTCKSSASQCTTLKACPSDRPVRCQNGECRTDINACPLTNQGLCSAQAPYQCPLGDCAQDKSSCRSANGCIDSLPFKCDDGTCAKSSSTCPSATTKTTAPNGCPVASPFKCPDGECLPTSRASSCKAVGTGCSVSLPFRCGDGTCAASQSVCTTKSSSCPTSTPLRCPNGQCVAANLYSSCLGSNGCPLNTPYRCNDGSCKTYPFPIPSDALAGCPVSTACADPTPLRCADGSCVAQTSDCLPIESCPANLPYRCEDTLVCAPSKDECPFFRCPVAVPVFCADSGKCVLKSSMCPTSSCSSATPFQCAWGECVSQWSECTKKSSCSGAYPFQCPDGACRTDASECKFIASCPTDLPYRCLDGRCATDSKTCPPSSTLRVLNALGAPLDQASVDSLMAKDATMRFAARQTTTSATSGSNCPSGFDRCADGTCAATGKCVAALGCTFPTPYMCPSGRCAVASTGCAESCNAGEYKCSDNSCARTPSLCPPISLPVLSEIIVTVNPRADTTIDFMGSNGPEFYSRIISGALATSQSLVEVRIKRRSRSEFASASWDPTAVLQSGVFSTVIDIPGPSITATPTSVGVRTNVTTGFGGDQRIVALATSTCVSKLADDLSALTDCTASPPYVDRSIAIAADQKELGIYAVVNKNAQFGLGANNLNSNPLPSSSSTALGSGAIVGIVFGVLLFVLIVLLIIILCLRRRKQNQAKVAAEKADKVAKQAADVEFFEDDQPMSEKMRKIEAVDMIKAAEQATANAPISLPVLAPKPKVKTLETLPPLVTTKAPQTVIPYRPSLPTLFAKDTTTSALSSTTDQRGQKNVDIATLHRTALEGLERSGAEDERPQFISSLVSRPGSRGPLATSGMGTPVASPANESAATTGKKRLFEIKPKLGASTPLALPVLPQTDTNAPQGPLGGAEDEPPPSFGTASPRGNSNRAPVASQRTQNGPQSHDVNDPEFAHPNAPK